MVKLKKNKKTKVKKVIRKNNKVYPAFNFTEFVLYIILAVIGFWVFIKSADYLNIPRVVSYLIIGILVFFELLKTRNR